MVTMSTRDLQFELPKKEERKHVNVDWEELARRLENDLRWNGRWLRCTLRPREVPDRPFDFDFAEFFFFNNSSNRVVSPCQTTRF